MWVEELKLPPPPQPASVDTINSPTRGRNIVHCLFLNCLDTQRVQAMAARSRASVSRAWGPGTRGSREGKVRGGLADGAVVATLTVIVLPGAAEFGETVHVDSGGALVHEKLTLWLNPPWPPRLNEYVAVCPGETVCDDEDPEAVASVKSCPVPVRLTVWVLPVKPLLLSVTVRVEEREPPSVGVNVTLIVQEPPAATLLSQLLVCAKSPLVVMPATLSAALPVLDSVTVCELLVDFTNSAANVSVAGETLATGTASPVPVRLMV